MLGMIPAVLMATALGTQPLASVVLTVQQLDTVVVILTPYVHQVGVYECVAVIHAHLPVLSCIYTVPPTQPTNVAAVNINRTSADVTWFVPRLTYGTETYVVLYGMSEDMLDQQSAIVFSGRDSSGENNYYSVTLENLQSYTLYYYGVVATNILSSTSSDINTFTTCEKYIPSFIIYIHKQYYSCLYSDYWPPS